MTVQENPDQIKALLDGGTVSDASPTVTIGRDIQFNASVNVAGSGPVLIIDSSGTATTQTGEITFTDNGSKITVDPILNAGQLQGAVKFEMPNTVGTRTLGGTANINRQLGFIQVLIQNDSARDLQLGQIDVINENGTVQVDRTSGIDNDTLVINQSTTTGATDVEINNAQGVILAGNLDNRYGTTSIGATTGNITRSSATVEIITPSVSLTATSGSIGTGTETAQRLAARPALATGATVWNVAAAGGVFLRQSQGSASIQGIHSSGGAWTCSAAERSSMAAGMIPLPTFPARPSSSPAIHRASVRRQIRWRLIPQRCRMLCPPSHRQAST